MDSMRASINALDAMIENLEKVLSPPSEPRAVAPQKKNKKKKPKPDTPGASVTPSASQFLQCDLRVARICEISPHPDADKLYVIRATYENDRTRVICAGLREYLTEEELMGRMVITICNLKARPMRGVQSDAMILAGSVVSSGGDTKEVVVPLAAPDGAEPGAYVDANGVQGERKCEGIVSSKTWGKVVGRLSVKNGKACYEGLPLLVNEQVITCDLPDNAEIH